MSKQAMMADDVIDNHVLWAMGAGAIPLPVLDVAVVTAIQLNMFRELCMVYQVDYNEAFGRNLISSIAGATLAKIGASFIKAIPVVGSLLGGVPMVVLSGASTYGMGQVFKKYLEVGGFVSTFSFENAQKIYEEAFEKGKSYVQDLQKKASEAMGFKGEEAKPNPSQAETKTNPAQGYAGMDVFEKLKVLGDLRDKGIITDEEFKEKKEKLLKEI
ncbi:MAG: DUF697 domain-containing protein [Microscillaceae bacterium]|jgi:uncharacterized protein (DUF697 family)|nr:DUF697 domain-containing protein [Microscillaceae bacterium]